MDRLYTPEQSILLQNSIGADLIMQLDDATATSSFSPARVKEASERTVHWLDRCIVAHKKPESQALFCVVHGGLDLELRRECCKQMMRRNVAGFAIGGLSGGEARQEYCKVYGALLV